MENKLTVIQYLTAMDEIHIAITKENDPVDLSFLGYPSAVIMNRNNGNLLDAICDKYKLNKVDKEHIIKHLLADDYIVNIATEGTYDGEFTMTTEGLLFSLRGGYAGDFKRKNRKDWLYITGQIAVIIAGLYYFIELLKDLHLFCTLLCHC